MRIRNMILAIMIASCLIACGGGSGAGSGGGLTLKINGADVPFEVKSTGVYPSTKTFTFTKDGQSTMTKAVNHYIALANFEMETRGPVTMGRTLAADGETRVIMQIVGAEGTDEKATMKAGTYMPKCDKYSCIEFLQLSRYAGGKEEKITVDMKKAEGEVRITSVTKDTISGEIDLTEGGNSVKGPFTAKITTKR